MPLSLPVFIAKEGLTNLGLDKLVSKESAQVELVLCWCVGEWVKRRGQWCDFPQSSPNNL